MSDLYQNCTTPGCDVRIYGASVAKTCSFCLSRDNAGFTVGERFTVGGRRKADNVVFVFGDPFVEYPRTRADRAKEVVEKAFGGEMRDHAYQRAVEGHRCAHDGCTGSSRPVSIKTPCDAPSCALPPDLHITFAGCHCGKVDCTRCDPLERYVDGLTVRECLARYEAWQREDVKDKRYANMKRLRDGYLNRAQQEAARTAWSTALKRKQAEQREKERNEVVVQDQWGDDD
jgi:hypothetical protein